jgi:hypothetical protein
MLYKSEPFGNFESIIRSSYYCAIIIYISLSYSLLPYLFKLNFNIFYVPFSADGGKYELVFEIYELNDA